MDWEGLIDAAQPVGCIAVRLLMTFGSQLTTASSASKRAALLRFPARVARVTAQAVQARSGPGLEAGRDCGGGFFGTVASAHNLLKSPLFHQSSWERIVTSNTLW